MAKANKNYHVPNLDRTLIIFELLSKNPTGMNRNEIAAASGCSTTMVYRIMLTLLDNGFVFRDEGSGSYRLSLKLLDIGLAGSDEYCLAHVAWPEMAALRDATDMTVMLGSQVSEFEGLLLETAESRAMSRYVAQKGLRVSTLHVGGWKCILAYWPEERLNAYLKQASFKKLTPNTPATHTAIMKALKKVRQDGYAIDQAEMTEGNHCAVAPIFDRTGMPVGPLCLSGLTSQLPAKDFKKRGREVREAADRISAKLGWNGKTNYQTQNVYQKTGVKL